MAATTTTKDKACFICARDTLDGAYPPLILAIQAVRAGMEAKIFFTFMGLNLLRPGGMDKAKFFPPGFMGAIPGMASVATTMMKKQIDKAQIPSLAELLEMAQCEGVGLVGCLMTLLMMEWKKEDLIEGVDIWTAEDFIAYARDAKMCLYI